MRSVDAFVIDLTHHALLILGFQQRQYRRDLVGSPIVPHAPAVRNILAVRAVPFRHCCIGMPGRSPSRFGIGEQRLVVFPVLKEYGLTMFSRGQSMLQSPQRADTGGLLPIRGSAVL